MSFSFPSSSIQIRGRIVVNIPAPPVHTKLLPFAPCTGKAAILLRGNKHMSFLAWALWSPSRFFLLKVQIGLLRITQAFFSKRPASICRITDDHHLSCSPRNLDLTRANCWISAQHQPGQFALSMLEARRSKNLTCFSLCWSQHAKTKQFQKPSPYELASHRALANSLR